MRELTNRFSR